MPIFNIISGFYRELYLVYCQGSRMEMLSLHLERIIAKAAVKGDETLTKRTCRDKSSALSGAEARAPTAGGGN